MIKGKIINIKLIERTLKARDEKGPLLAFFSGVCDSFSSVCLGSSMDFIKSIQNPLVKHFVRLASSKSYRREEKSAVVFGSKIIKEISTKIRIKKYLTLDFPLEAAETNLFITPQVAKKIFGHASFEDSIAEVDLPLFQDLSQKSRILVLDNVQDPGNVGTILRTALGLGFEGIHFFGNCADPFNQKAISASKGSAFTLPLSEGPIELLGKRFNWYAADMGGTDIATATFQKPYILAFGNEGSGLCDEIKNRSKIVAIGLKNQVESLNVASAAAIFCYLGIRSEL